MIGVLFTRVISFSARIIRIWLDEYSKTPHYGHPSTAVTPALRSLLYGPEWLPFKYMLR